MAVSINVRPCVILIENEKVLCIHCKYAEEFYLFPGGGVELGETLEDCAIREMKEETGIKVKIENLVYVNDWIKDKSKNERVLNVFFIGRKVGGELIAGERDGGKVKKVVWIPLNKLNTLDFRPKLIAERLEQDFKSGFSRGIYFK